jgi:hypothetical protein
VYLSSVKFSHYTSNSYLLSNDTSSNSRSDLGASILCSTEVVELECLATHGFLTAVDDTVLNINLQIRQLSGKRFQSNEETVAGLKVPEPDTAIWILSSTSGTHQLRQWPDEDTYSGPTRPFGSNCVKSKQPS